MKIKVLEWLASLRPWIYLGLFYLFILKVYLVTDKFFWPERDVDFEKYGVSYHNFLTYAAFFVLTLGTIFSFGTYLFLLLKKIRIYKDVYFWIFILGVISLILHFTIDPFFDWYWGAGE
ncbi:MAG: hypothetical protein SFU87_20785 [Chitinophagaceae bacterium]|nr:hypothetical protein [Chitinophagaceae bacterium]